MSPFLQGRETDEVVHAAGVAGVAAVGEKMRFTVGTGGAGVEDILFLEPQSAKEPDVGRPEIEERLSGPAGGLGEHGRCERGGDTGAGFGDMS